MGKQSLRGHFTKLSVPNLKMQIFFFFYALRKEKKKRSKNNIGM